MQSTRFTYCDVAKSSESQNSSLDQPRIDYDSVYVHINELKDETKPHYKRTIFRIENANTGDYILRKVKGRLQKGLTLGLVAMHYTSASDLNLTTKDENNLVISPARGVVNQMKYFKQHPNEEIRMAYQFFRYGIWLGFISIALSIVSIFS